jgi:hypothetical protein
MPGQGSDMKGTWQTTSGGGGGGLVLVVIVAALAIGSGAVSAAVHVLEVAVIVLGAVIGLAVLGGAALLVHRARSEGRRRPIAARPVYQLPPEQAPQLEESHKTALSKTSVQNLPPGGKKWTPELDSGPRAIEPPQLHLHIDGADPQVIAAIMRHLTKEE